MDLNGFPKSWCDHQWPSEGQWLFLLCPQNWMRNSLKVHSDSVLEQVWNIFSEASSSVSSLHFAIAMWQTTGNKEMGYHVWGGSRQHFQRLSVLSPWRAAMSWEHLVCRHSLSPYMLSCGICVCNDWHSSQAECRGVVQDSMSGWPVSSPCCVFCVIDHGHII